MTGRGMVSRAAAADLLWLSAASGWWMPVQVPFVLVASILISPVRQTGLQMPFGNRHLFGFGLK